VTIGAVERQHESIDTDQGVGNTNDAAPAAAKR
jgi:hypothetical protein